MAFVIDASICVAWCALDQATALSTAAFEHAAANGGHVPAQFWFEVSHSLTQLTRSRSLDRDTTDMFMDSLAAISLNVDAAHDAVTFRRVRAFGRHYALTTYDASYVELAQRLNLPLATKDRAMAAAMLRAGGRLFAP